ncbi:helix-turn-helix transcriptional regulator [Chrysiogenes arsenatis]|uniref:helix-turn-helix transcriptional regulator n=1 Tax=Chrysiogenes arsenatis TaxID=309797 RepID=UPI0003F7D6B6|nr:winged helix-turn-helix domain-containing protein [Chrysiogenes arsenatis]
MPTHESQPERKTPGGEWTFLNNHTHVLLCLAREPGARLRDVAQLVGITERAVQKIVRELEESAVLQRFRDGRRNRYQIDLQQPLRHPLESNFTVGELLGLFFHKEESN